jgi:carbon monoxide dehydrogenase subunit G
MRANGKIPGSAVAMTSTMDLADDGADGTLMNWSSDVRVSGTIAGVGARLMSGVADRMTKDIFGCIKSKLESE